MNSGTAGFQEMRNLNVQLPQIEGLNDMDKSNF